MTASAGILRLTQQAAIVLLDGLGAMVQATAGLLVLALYHPALYSTPLIVLFGIAGWLVVLICQQAIAKISDRPDPGYQLDWC